MLDQSPDLFDRIEAEKQRDHGMEQAATKQHRLLTLARGIAVEVAMTRPDRTCNADDVTRLLNERHGIYKTGNWFGSVFKGSEWEFTGRFLHSAKITSHARMIREWRYVGGGNG